MRRACPLIPSLTGWNPVTATFTLTTTILALLLLTHPAKTLAQSVGYAFPVDDPQAVVGDILTLRDSKIVRADKPYDNEIFGALQNKPALLFKVQGTVNGQPIVKDGIAMVNVTAQNGPISYGDFITSSPEAGKGQKATKSGYVLGTAMGNLKEGTGQILVSVKPEYAEITTAVGAARLLNYVNESIFRTQRNPEKFLKGIQYVAAGVVALSAFVLAFLTFSKAVVKGIESVGRNPMAKGTIYVSIVINLIMTVTTVGFGILAAVVIISF
ncbi:MAG: hypothetical protein HYW33_01575 [Candidatus Blackburnbacteria bacterium]|nr:hypothetical protein [Candidatus Blackburnbacteria bacterium]